MSQNYLENVPVKISENYKPPPQIYQVSRTISQKLSLPENHYDNDPEFNYNFQLEKKVLVTVAKLRRVRHLEKEERRQRQLRREQLRIKQIEEKHKQMLGAVNYPSTEELSSSSESDAGTPTNRDDVNKVVSSLPLVNNCFDNILKPTIVANTSLESNQTSSISMLSNSWKHASAFNYKDFEVDTSSPFDNVELKSINDLDVLAQVLNNVCSSDSHETTTNSKSNESCPLSNSNDDDNDVNKKVNGLDTNSEISIEQCKADLQKVDFNYEVDETINIPVLSKDNASKTTTHHLTSLPQFTQYDNYINGEAAPHLISSSNASHMFLSDAEFALKSKSVPDILRELSDEVRNSEIRRRSRNHSYNKNEAESESGNHNQIDCKL